MEISERTFGGRYFVVAITAIVIALIMWRLLERLDREIINAERAQFELRLSEIRSAILLMQASLVAKDDMALAVRYLGTNPMDWMEPGQDHYLGEISLEEASQMNNIKGKWVFDPERKEIAYLPNALRWRTEETDFGAQWLRYKVGAIWSEEAGADGQRHRIVKGLKLEPMQQAFWQQQAEQ